MMILPAGCRRPDAARRQDGKRQEDDYTQNQTGHTQMESLSDNTRVGWAGCLLLGMTLLAILLTLGSAMSRADSERELVEGRVVDLVIVAPLWAAWVFINMRCRGRSNTRAITFACAVYIFVASSLVALNIWKHNMRTSGWDRMRNQEATEGP
jgi:hypothetical protein